MLSYYYGMLYGAEKGNAPISIVGFFPVPFRLRLRVPEGIRADELCDGRESDQGGNEGGCRSSGTTNNTDIINESATQKSCALPGQALFEAPEAPFRNVATPPFEGAPVVFANRPDPVMRRPAQAPPEKRSDARRRLSKMMS